MNCKIWIMIFITLLAISCQKDPESKKQDYQHEIRSILSRFSELATKGDVETLADLFVPGCALEARDQFGQLKKHLDSIEKMEFLPLSFLIAKNVCYVNVGQTIIQKNEGNTDKNNTQQQTGTFVFIHTDEKSWKILDNFRWDNLFIFDDLLTKCESLAKSLRDLKEPWTLEELEDATKKFKLLEEDVRDAAISSPESSMFGGSIYQWTKHIDARELELSALLAVLKESISKETNKSQKTKLIRQASDALVAAVDILILMVTPVLQIINVEDGIEYITIEAKLHPIVFLVDKEIATKQGFAVDDIQNNDANLQLYFIKASNFELMDNEGWKTKAADIGTENFYRKKYLKVKTKTHNDSSNVLELVANQNYSFNVLFRFKKKEQDSKPYKIIIGEADGQGVLLIRPGNSPSTEKK